MNDATIATDLKAVGHAWDTIRERVGTRVIGMEDVLELLTIVVLTGNHCLLVGVPGLAKTLVVSTLAGLLDLKFSRIQFTPDLMPSDVVGSTMIEGGGRERRFLAGPVFANLLLADEINRTPPKTQAALMEAMEEHAVTVAGRRHALEEPFFVLATQNPIEQQGTYSLPAAQLDRFLFRIDVAYPTRENEVAVVRSTTGVKRLPETESVLGQEQILNLMAYVRDTAAPSEVTQLATSLARITRPDDPAAPETVKKHLAFGVGPRAAQGLVMGAKARALLHGRERPTIEDVTALCHSVFEHRLVLNFVGAGAKVQTSEIVNEVLAAVAGGRGASA